MWQILTGCLQTLSSRPGTGTLIWPEPSDHDRRHHVHHRHVHHHQSHRLSTWKDAPYLPRRVWSSHPRAWLQVYHPVDPVCWADPAYRDDPACRGDHHRRGGDDHQRRHRHSNNHHNRNADSHNHPRRHNGQCDIQCQRYRRLSAAEHPRMPEKPRVIW